MGTIGSLLATGRRTVEQRTLTQAYDCDRCRDESPAVVFWTAPDGKSIYLCSAHFKMVHDDRRGEWSVLHPSV